MQLDPTPIAHDDTQIEMPNSEADGSEKSAEESAEKNEMHSPTGDSDEDGTSSEEENNTTDPRIAQSHAPQGHWTPPPGLQSAKDALADIKSILKPRRPNGKPGHLDPGLNARLQSQLESMRLFLCIFCDEKSDVKGHNGARWTAASLQAARNMERGPCFARTLREWTHAFINDREELPPNNYGKGNKCHIDDEDLAQEIQLHLQGLGKYIKASDIIHYLDTPEMLSRLGRKKTISERTARNWMKRMGYRWTKDPKGQYADGHERANVIAYRQKILIPAWSILQAKTRRWAADNIDGADSASDGRKTVVWFHDESIFYAHDRRKQRWVHKSETAVPYTKGEGASLMVADFVSADYGWLRSPDGAEKARVLFKPGKNRDGYFTHEDIIQQAEHAIDILTRHYPQDDHVFVFDNAPTHLKRAEGALSARKMPKSTSKPGHNFGVEVNVTGEDGKLVYGPDGKVIKVKVPMSNGTLPDGREQSFYFPEGHEHAGMFKGMAIILEERGFTGVTGRKSKNAQCGKNFSCKPGATDCCCRRILYNQPDFVGVESLLEKACKARNSQVLFLPEFHCELNPIEQCWGTAKREYRLLPPSSKEADLETNVLGSLEEVSLISIRR